MKHLIGFATMAHNLAEKLIELEFDEETHTYYFDNKVIPGVTTVIKPLMNFDNINEEVLQRKSVLGTAAHKATELFDEDNLDESSVHPAIIPYLDAWKKFRDETKIEILSSEAKVFYQKYGYAGTYDRIALLYGSPCLIDIKCTSVLGPHVGTQLAAYKEAHNATNDFQVSNRFAVQLRPDGTYRLQEYKDRTDFPVFLSCLQIYKWKNKHAITN